jgi:hypothetical protein
MINYQTNTYKETNGNPILSGSWKNLYILLLTIFFSSYSSSYLHLILFLSHLQNKAFIC